MLLPGIKFSIPGRQQHTPNSSTDKLSSMATNHEHHRQNSNSVDPKQGGCGRNCLSKCCLLRGAELPLFAFASAHKESNGSFLDMLFKLAINYSGMNACSERMLRGIFRHDLTSCQAKVMNGEHGFIAQFNEGRHLTRRPTEFRVDRVVQAFHATKFNFTKVGQEEALFRFEENASGDGGYFSIAPINPASPLNIVAINVSPIEYGHVLLIPRILECLPQRIEGNSFLLALHMAMEAADPHFRLGYNSLGAFATVNHLHFQAYYLAMPFPVEKADTLRVATLENGVEIHKLSGYPVKGLVFRSGRGPEDLSHVVSTVCTYLQENDSPFNILIADSGRRVFLFPQCYVKRRALGQVSQEILDMQMNPAIWEICGHMVLKMQKDYDEASETKVCALLDSLSLSEEHFQEVCEHTLKEVHRGNGSSIISATPEGPMAQ